MLSLIVVSAMLGADAPAVAPWNFEARMDAVEARLTALESKQKVSAAAPATCPCGPNCPCCAACQATAVGTRPDGSKIVAHSDGSFWLRTCDANGCRETPYQGQQLNWGWSSQPTVQLASYTAIPCATCPGGVMYVGDDGSGGTIAAGGGGCGSGKKSGKGGGLFHCHKGG